MEMKGCLALFLGALLWCGKVAGDTNISNVRGERDLGYSSKSSKSSKSMMQMRKWRYSDAAKLVIWKGMAASYKGGKSGSGKSSTKSGYMRMMRMRRMMMMRGKGKGGEYTPAYIPTPKPTPKPTRFSSDPPEPTPLPTIQLDDSAFRRCLIGMAVSDINRDDWLDRMEYVRFILRLGMAQFVGETFDDLDPLLQDNFDFLAGEESSLNVTGSKPGQTIEDDQNLRRICTYTMTLLDNGVNIPTRVPSPATDEFLAVCFLSMAISDTDLNDQLSEAEYVSFLNRFSDDINVETFDDLDEVLRENFFRLGPDGFIVVEGARPGQEPTEDLVSVCLLTQEAVETSLEA